MLISNAIIIAKKNIFNKSKKILSFEIENNTKDDLRNLFLKADLFVNGELYTFEKHPITHSKPLSGLEKLKYDEIVIPPSVKFNNLNENNDIFVKFYAKKEKKAPWILLKIEFLNI